MGQIVKIEVGKKIMVGVVIKKVSKPSSYKTKDITSAIESMIIPEKLVLLSLWMSTYYLTHLALVIQLIVPKGIDSKRRLKSQNDIKSYSRKRTNYLTQ